MNKILVAIDFSTNSRKTIRFAILLASQSNAEIIFLNLMSFLIPTSYPTWDFNYYSQFQDERLQQNKERLDKLIKEVYKSNLPSGVKYTCDCQLEDNVGEQIISYAKNHKIDFICVGARGTGVLTKLFGTVAEHLITNSHIPVFVIPKNYRLKPITEICYASDMENLESEIKKVLELANLLRASVKILHFDFELSLIDQQDRFNNLAQKYETKNVKFQYKKLDTLYPLHDYLIKAITLLKPSLVIFFTKQNRNWLDRILLYSETATLSFTSKVPLLVYRKTSK